MFAFNSNWWPAALNEIQPPATTRIRRVRLTEGLRMSISFILESMKNNPMKHGEIGSLSWITPIQTELRQWNPERARFVEPYHIANWLRNDRELRQNLYELCLEVHRGRHIGNERAAPFGSINYATGSPTVESGAITVLAMADASGVASISGTEGASTNDAQVGPDNVPISQTNAVPAFVVPKEHVITYLEDGSVQICLPPCTEEITYEFQPRLKLVRLMKDKVVPVQPPAAEGGANVVPQGDATEIFDIIPI